MICVVIARTVWKTHSNTKHKMSERATSLGQITYKEKAHDGAETVRLKKKLKPQNLLRHRTHRFAVSP